MSFLRIRFSECSFTILGVAGDAIWPDHIATLRCDYYVYDSLVQKVGTMSYGLLCGHGSTLISGFFTLHTIVFRINEAHALRRYAGFESGEEKAAGGGRLGCGIISRDELAGWVLE